MCCCALFVGNIPPMSLQNPKIPSKSKRAKMADETELFCISASKTVVFARLLGVRQRPPQGAEFVCVPCGANNSKSSAARRAGSSPATGTITTEASAVLFSPQGETERWRLLFLMQISYMTLHFRKIRLKAPAPIFKRLMPVFLEFLRFILLQNNWICLELMTAHGIIK